jgi:hypothetical protein
VKLCSARFVGSSSQNKAALGPPIRGVPVTQLFFGGSDMAKKTPKLAKPPKPVEPEPLPLKVTIKLHY